MSNEILSGGKLFALPFDLNRGPPERFTELMDWMSEHAGWFAGGETPEQVRENVAWMMADDSQWKWDIYSGGTFAGVILLSRIVPRVDALFHFTLFPAAKTGVTLFSARRLLWNFLGYAFDEFQLQRVSVEIPEHAPKLAKFLRGRMGFKFEGEGDPERLKKNKGVLRFDVPGTPTWIAAHGSRRERAHWHDGRWSDLILLRLLRDEYIARASLGEMPNATHDDSSNVDESRIEVGPVHPTQPA